MEGVTLAEVEGFLDGCNDVGFDPIRKTSVGELRSNAIKAPCLTIPLTIIVDYTSAVTVQMNPAHLNHMAQ